MDVFADYRARIVAAECSGRPEIFEELLPDDAVILAPGLPPIEGRDACLEFVRSVLAGLHAMFERDVTCDSAEVVVSGNLAFDRGRFSQTLTPRDGGFSQHEDGHYVWMYRRDDTGRWWLVRIIGSTAPAQSFTPIGVVRSAFTETTQIPKGPGAQHSAEGTIEISEALAEGLQDIEGFSHLYVIWQFHRRNEEEASLLAQPPTADQPHGVFSTRAPHRPNPIALTVVELVRREGRRLYVRGVDMLDGTPVLDIKPYLSSVPADQVRRGWMEVEKGTPR